MRVSYQNECYEVVEARVEDGYFYFKTADGDHKYKVKLGPEPQRVLCPPIQTLCRDGYIQLDDYAERTTTVQMAETEPW